MTTIVKLVLKDHSFLNSPVNRRIYDRLFLFNRCYCRLNEETGSAIDNSGTLIASANELEQFFEVVELSENKSDIHQLIEWHESEIKRLKKKLSLNK